MLAIFKREFKACFQSVVGWLFVAALLAVFGLYFYVYNLRGGYPYVYYSFSAVTLLFLIAIPILTMRSFSEERKNKTDQLIFTAPVSIGKVVFGKYLALAAVFTIDVVIFALTPLVLSSFGTVPMGENYAALLGFWLYGCVCIAVCMFISSLTESQVIAAVLSFVVLFICYLMQGICSLISANGNWLTSILSCMDINTPFAAFCNGTLPLTGVVYYISVIAFMNFLTVQSIQKRRWSMTKKNFSTGVFSTSLIAVALVLTVIVNLAVNALPATLTSIDCSYNKLYSITDQTKEYLKSLDEDVTIYVLVAESQKDAQVDEVLRHYEDLSKHINVEYVNPSVKPYFYQDYTETAPSSNSLIVVSPKRSKVIGINDIYVYDYSFNYSTYSYDSELVAFDAEGQITSAIEYVTMEASELPVVYALEGHGESSLGSAFEEMLEKANITLSGIDLLNEDGVPEDAAAIIINAPQTDFNAADAKKVIDYLQGGGQAIVTGIVTLPDLENFHSILNSFGVSLTAGVIAENDLQHYYNWGNPFYLLPFANSTDYTSNVGGSYVYVPMTAGITYTETDGVDFVSLMDTTDQAVAKNDYQNMQSYEFEEGDDEGPFSLGVVAEIETGGDPARLAVFGTPLLFSDDASQMTGNNAVLFSDMISNMVGDTQLAASVIPQKYYTLSALTVNASSGVILGLLSTILIPLALLVIGIVIFAVRRKK